MKLTISSEGCNDLIIRMFVYPFISLSGGCSQWLMLWILRVAFEAEKEIHMDKNFTCSTIIQTRYTCQVGLRLLSLPLSLSLSFLFNFPPFLPAWNWQIKLFCLWFISFPALRWKSLPLPVPKRFFWCYESSYFFFSRC